MSEAIGYASPHHILVCLPDKVQGITREQLRHLLRAASRLTDEKQFFVFGSQSILGKFESPPELLVRSVEADLVSKNYPESTLKLETIGIDSDFQNTHGYYADACDISDAILPKGWKGRLVNLESHFDDNKVAYGLCLDPHDLALSKYVAGREKDLEFNQALIQHRMVERNKLEMLLKKLDVDQETKARISRKIDAHFSLPIIESEDSIEKSRKLKP